MDFVIDKEGDEVLSVTMMRSDEVRIIDVEYNSPLMQEGYAFVDWSLTIEAQGSYGIEMIPKIKQIERRTGEIVPLDDAKFFYEMDSFTKGV